MYLAERSPHLAMVAERYFGREQLPIFDKVFTAAMKSGAESELDFTRVAEQSFNPRPARVGLILMNDAKVHHDQATVLAGILATAGNALRSAESPADIPDEVLHLARLSLGPAGSFLGSNDERLKDAGLIALALRFDRARHIHQTSVENKRHLWEEFFSETKDYIQLAEELSEPLCVMLKAWEKRFAAKLRNASRDNGNK